jgi:sirohydrochlorin ferrochelatase
MMSYDPEHTAESAAWLALEEGERIRLVAAYHRAAGITPPNAQVHAAMHSVVENQIAEELVTVRETIARLCGEGLSRHEAVHAVGWVLMTRLARLMRPGASGEFEVEDYFRELRTLTAAGWSAKIREHGGD